MGRSLVEKRHLSRRGSSCDQVEGVPPQRSQTAGLQTGFVPHTFCLSSIVNVLSCQCQQIREFHMKLRFPTSSEEKKQILCGMWAKAVKEDLQVWGLHSWNKGDAVS